MNLEIKPGQRGGERDFGQAVEKIAAKKNRMSAFGLILGNDSVNRRAEGLSQFFKDLFPRAGDIDGQDKSTGHSARILPSPQAPQPGGRNLSPLVASASERAGSSAKVER